MGKTTRNSVASRSEHPMSMNKYGRGWRKKEDRTNNKSKRSYLNLNSTKSDFTCIEKQIKQPTIQITYCGLANRRHYASPNKMDFHQNQTFKSRSGTQTNQDYEIALNKRIERRGNNNNFRGHP